MHCILMSICFIILICDIFMVFGVLKMHCSVCLFKHKKHYCFTGCVSFNVWELCNLAAAWSSLEETCCILSLHYQKDPAVFYNTPYSIYIQFFLLILSLIFYNVAFHMGQGFLKPLCQQQPQKHSTSNPLGIIKSRKNQPTIQHSRKNTSLWYSAIYNSEANTKWPHGKGRSLIKILIILK